MSLYEITYTSTARRSLTDGDIDAIVAVARRRNEASGITGLLIFHDGVFGQTLEGPRDALEALMRAIERDPRHHSLNRLHEGRIRERRFGDWGMERHPDPGSYGRAVAILTGVVPPDFGAWEVATHAGLEAV